MAVDGHGVFVEVLLLLVLFLLLVIFLVGWRANML